MSKVRGQVGTLDTSREKKGSKSRLTEIVWFQEHCWLSLRTGQPTLNSRADKRTDHRSEVVF